MVWLTVLLIATQATCWAVAVVGPNTCSRQETFMVTMRVLEKKPVTIKTYTWCFNMPPRCTKYKQELVDHYRIQSEPRVQWIHECCPGYKPDAENVACKPVCPLGCEHGVCTAPLTCSCHPGYIGMSCDKGCPEGQWGSGCEQTCSCHNSALCHHETGACSCPPGFRGSRCESICPTGTYGDRCENLCLCGDNATCHHLTGSCDTFSRCNGSSECETEWTPTKPEVIQRLLDNSATPYDKPVHEPLVTTSEYIGPSDTQISEEISNNTSHIWDSSTLDNDATVGQSELRFTGLEISDTILVTTVRSSSQPDVHLSTEGPTALYSSTSGPSGENKLTKEASSKRFIEEESHEDQLEHLRTEESTQTTPEGIGTTQETEEATESFSEQPENQEIFVTKVLPEEATEDTNSDVLGQDSELREITTQGPYQHVQKWEETVEPDLTTSNKTEEQRKKITDQKKFTLKERVKDIPNQKSDTTSQKSAESDHDWIVPEFDRGESPKHFEQVQEGPHRDHMAKIVDTGKPKKMLEQKQGKDLADAGQMKITSDQERKLGDSKNSYNDFLSSFSIAAGVSTGIIMVAGLITLMARCRRAKPKEQSSPPVEMETITSKQDEVRTSMLAEEATLPVVRPLFFSPVYLPGDIPSPTEVNGGLILTAVFSRQATTIHDLYRQQDLLRETLAPHYDVPPPTGTRTSVCTSTGTAETEHVYEELPCWRNQTASSHNESQC